MARSVWKGPFVEGSLIKKAEKSRGNIRSEVEQSFDLHAAAGTRLGGVHLELTGEDVTECTGGARDLTDARHVLLADPSNTAMQPLVERLLLQRSPELERFWGNTGLEVLKLADVLVRVH